MSRARVTEEDELFLRLDRAGEPWSVHAEVWVGGSLDLERLQSAVQAAVKHHPMARASLSPGPPGRREWEIAASARTPAPEPVEYAGEAELNEIRERTMSATPALDAAPPYLLTIGRGPGRDALILNLNHGVGDGIAALRLLASILRSYAGEDDPLPDIDPLRMRDLREFAGRRTLGDRLHRVRERRKLRENHVGEPVRVESTTNRSGPAGLKLVRLEPAQLEAARARRQESATFNDLLIATLAVTVREWNDERGIRPGPIAISVPVNIRPERWSRELLANLAATLTVTIPAGVQTSLDAAQQAVAGRTRRLKTQQFAELLAAGGVIPVSLRRLLSPLLRAGDEKFTVTAVLSNVGRSDLPERLGPDLPVEAVFFSPPVQMPAGLALGVAHSPTGLGLVVRYGPKLFDDQSAADFSARFKGILLA